MIAFAEGFRYFETVHPEEAKSRQIQIGEATVVNNLKEHQEEQWGAVLNRLKRGTTELVYVQQAKLQEGAVDVEGAECHIALKPTMQEWMQSSEDAETFLARYQLNAGEWRQQVVRLLEASAATHGWGRQQEREARARKRERDLQLDK